MLSENKMALQYTPSVNYIIPNRRGSQEDAYYDRHKVRLGKLRSFSNMQNPSMAQVEKDLEVFQSRGGGESRQLIKRINISDAYTLTRSKPNIMTFRDAALGRDIQNSLIHKDLTYSHQDETAN